MYTQEELASLTCKAAGLSGVKIDFDEKLINYGVDSISVMKIVSLLRRSGIRAKFADLMENPTINSWTDLLNSKFTKVETYTSDKSSDKPDIQEPFSLTDIQYAYWVGRGEEQPMGGVDCHAYYEFTGKNIDSTRLEIAWNALLHSHKALRTVVKDGKQTILSTPYKKSFTIHDFRNDVNAAQSLLTVRNSLSHRMLDIENGEMAGLSLCLMPEHEHVICLDFALIAADVKSIQIILRDLSRLYTNPAASIDSDWSFQKYLSYIGKTASSEKEASNAYWRKKAAEMPPAPALPLTKQPEQIKSPKITHYADIIDSKSFENFKAEAKQQGVTVPMALMTVYAKVLAKWSNQKSLLLNVPLFDRDEAFPGTKDAVADFTTLVLASIHLDSERSFAAEARLIQENFINSMHYTATSGVEVQRILSELHPGQQFFAPCVFACNIGLDFTDSDFEENLGSLTWQISQTPQVWIDCQIFERKGQLFISFDVCDELFPKGMPSAMFESFASLVRELSGAANEWNQSVHAENKIYFPRKSEKDTQAEYPNSIGLLTDCLIYNAKSCPDRIALYDSLTKSEISYADLYKKSCSVASALKAMGGKKGDRIAIKLKRGMNQIIAIYGVLLAGMTYVPISYSQPTRRLEKIINSVGTGIIISDEDQNLSAKQAYTVLNLKKADLQPLSDTFEAENINPEDTAYIIMTSGSTGEPKGVEISHASALNTILDVSARNHISEKDTFLAVSAIDFDLSVYDIFGSSAAGGKLVILNEDNAKDAEAWLELIRKEKITVWNSVPVLLDMLLTAAQGQNTTVALEKIMLSGDWISNALIQKAQRIAVNAKIVAMGGATEAAIWSNEYPVPNPVSEHFHYMPYGHALKGQIYRVVDENGIDCPDWVPGELWIGGFGVAKGYFGDEAKTRAKFTSDGDMRWYHTGDLGRFTEDGIIEFLGRMDFQVKVKGHRVELGEIESCIRNHSDVENAVAIVSREEEENDICLYYTVNGADPGEEELKDHARQGLPEYMIPSRWMKLEKIPVTFNGKIDRKSLPRIDKESTSSEDECYQTETEKLLADIWKELLNVNEVKRDADYFELGGNSLNATKAIYQIREKMGVNLKISHIFRTPELKDMASQIDEMKRMVKA